MALLAVVLLAILVILGGAFIVAPLRTRRRTMGRDEVRQAFAQRESAIQLIRDFEHDHKTGKLGEDDYVAVRNEAEARAIEAMKRYDRLGGTEGDDPVERAIREERSRIEKGART